MNNLNDELLSEINNRMALDLTKKMYKNNLPTKKMLEIIQNYGISEDNAVLMMMEFAVLEQE